MIVFPPSIQLVLVLDYKIAYSEVSNDKGKTK